MTRTDTPTRPDDSQTDRPRTTDRPGRDDPVVDSATGEPGPTGERRRAGAPLTFSPTSDATMGQFDTEADREPR